MVALSVMKEKGMRATKVSGSDGARVMTAA
jgi:hypothetical protein